jgi:transcriptional regulator with XRE-family HTH domain
MYASHELSHSVRTRRQEIGLSQKALAALSGLSRSTISQIEAGTLKDLSLTRTATVLEVLGLGLTIAPAHPRIRDASAGSKPLDLAARTASVSYAEMLPPDILREALRGGAVAPGFEPHIGTLLEEAPLSMLAKVVEQVHADFDTPRETVWANMRRIATEQKVIREIWDA